jgi:hypothetical protein
LLSDEAQGKTSLAWNQALDGTSLNWPTTNHTGTLAATTRADIQPISTLTDHNIITLRCAQQHTEGEAPLTAEMPMRDTLLDSGSFTFTIISKRIVDELLKSSVRLDCRKINLGLNSPLKGDSKGHTCHETVQFRHY